MESGVEGTEIEDFFRDLAPVDRDRPVRRRDAEASLRKRQLRFGRRSGGGDGRRVRGKAEVLEDAA